MKTIYDAPTDQMVNVLDEAYYLEMLIQRAFRAGYREGYLDHTEGKLPLGDKNRQALPRRGPSFNFSLDDWLESLPDALAWAASLRNKS